MTFIYGFSPVTFILLAFTVFVALLLIIRFSYAKYTLKKPAQEAPTMEQLLTDASVQLDQSKEIVSELVETSTPVEIEKVEEFDITQLDHYAKQHASLLVRQMAQVLVKELEAPPRIRTVHYIRLRTFLNAVSPETLVAYDKLHKSPKGVKEREAAVKPA